MDVFEAIFTRHMCRNFDPEKELPEDALENLLEAGRAAPSAGGLEDQRFTVIQEAKDKKLLVPATSNQQFNLADAAVVIVISSDLKKVAEKYGKRGRSLYAAQDCAAASENILLGATALGLGACWVGAFDEEIVKKNLKLPDSWRPMVLVPIGYAKP